jgi:hypothetical protein
LFGYVWRTGFLAFSANQERSRRWNHTRLPDPPSCKTARQMPS